MDFLYQFRQFLSGPPALIVMLLIVTMPMTKVMERFIPKELFEQPIDLSEPPPPPPPPPKIEVPKEQVEKVEAVLPQPPADVITKDSVVLDVKPAPPEPPRAIETPRTEVPIEVAPKVDINAIQGNYERIIRSYLESIKRYPTSREARSQRPTGKVGLWLEVTREGILKDAGIAKTSDSIILDNAALASVRQGKFPSFPPVSYVGEASHRFTVTLEYNLESQN